MAICGENAPTNEGELFVIVVYAETAKCSLSPSTDNDFAEMATDFRYSSAAAKSDLDAHSYRYCPAPEVLIMPDHPLEHLDGPDDNP